MAKEFTFILGGSTFAAAPLKLERKKIYGWSSLIATDRDGHICTAAYISPEDSLMIPSGAAKMATVDEDGIIVKKSDLVAFCRFKLQDSFGVRKDFIRDMNNKLSFYDDDLIINIVENVSKSYEIKDTPINKNKLPIITKIVLFIFPFFAIDY